MFPSSGLYFAIIISNSVGSRAHEKLNADNLPTEKLVQIFFKTASLKEKRKKKKKTGSGGAFVWVWSATYRLPDSVAGMNHFAAGYLNIH